MPENPVNEPNSSSPHLSAHDLVRKLVEDENYHVSEEDLKNIDTAAELTEPEQKAAKNDAENIENENPTTPYDLLGK